MNKLTKLLSVFVVAGAVSAGVAGLAGCGSTPEPHVHNATLHEATAATCTQDGNIAYYTCSTPGCENKYYSDEACTQEITDIVIPATGHTEVYEDKGDGTHGITCEKGDLSETVEAHVDEDHDGECDKCNAAVAGTYVPEVAATCTLEGVRAHYILGDGSDGKFYSDVNCENEVTAEDLVIAKIAHTYSTYTPDSEYAKHTSVCDECGEDLEEDCVDEDGDGKCDKCGGDVSYLANAFAPGAYVNRDYGIEVVIGENGYVSYVEGQGSSAKESTLTKVNAYTATFSYEFREETYDKTLILTKKGLIIDEYLLELMPEEIVTSSSDFAGVFKGEITYTLYGSTYKVTEFGMDGYGMIIFTQTEIVNGEETSTLTTLRDGTNSEVKYNNFSVDGLNFIATEVNDYGYVTKIELKAGSATATFTLDETAGVPEVPTTLGLDTDTYYTDSTGTYSIVVTSSGYQLNAY
ncbi:MAG: hypothetical protein ACI4MC_05100, partial [Candidatus Coproplasma sp.]